jgi:hypothetical protein
MFQMSNMACEAAAARFGTTLKGRQLANSHSKGRVVWITGAGSGIGRACALAFAEAGARLALSGRTVEKLRETAALTGAPDDILLVAGDIAAEQDIARMHAEIVGRLGDPRHPGQQRRIEYRPASLARHPARIGGRVDPPAGLRALPGQPRRASGHAQERAGHADPDRVPGRGHDAPALRTGLYGRQARARRHERQPQRGGGHPRHSQRLHLPGEVETPILDKRPAPPDAAQRALMLQPEDIAAAAVFCAGLPPRASVTRLVIQPTDESVYRNAAKFIEALPEPS